MADEWDDDPKLREVFGHQLRAHVAYQHGGDSEAPSLIFADADYEVGDGSCGLSEDGKRCNEPAIIYVRADAVLALRARVAELESALEQIAEYLPMFDYAGSDEFGARMDRPGSPFDRGREQEAKHLSGIARAALKDTD